MEHIATRCTHHLVGCRDVSERQDKWPFMRPIQREFYNNYVLIILHIKFQKLAMHIGECLGINFNGFANIVPVVFDSCGNIIEVTVISKYRHERLYIPYFSSAI